MLMFFALVYLCELPSPHYIIILYYIIIIPYTSSVGSYNHLHTVSDPCRRPDQRQRAFHLRSPGSRGEIPQRRQLGLLPLLPQQPAVPIVTATLRHVGRDAVGSEPPTGGLQEQSLPQPAAERHSWPHHGVQPGPARQQVRKD